MTIIYTAVAIILLGTIAAGTFRAWRGPTAGDRFLVIQLFGTAAVAVLILVAEAFDRPALVDIALVLALLAAITLVAFVRHTWTEKGIDEPRD